MPEKTMEEFREMTLKVGETLDGLGLTNGELMACLLAIIAATGRAAPTPDTVERLVVGLVLLTEELVEYRQTLMDLKEAKEENRIC